MKDPLLKSLHEALMGKVNKDPMIHGRGLPVRPEPVQVPLVPQDRWAMTTSYDIRALEKTFHFMTLEERNAFVTDAIDIEAQHKHCAIMTLDGLQVHVKLHTKNVGIPTEIDKELAMYLDEVYRDVTFAARMGA